MIAPFGETQAPDIKSKLMYTFGLPGWHHLQKGY